jgi:hypothetical protein
MVLAVLLALPQAASAASWRTYRLQVRLKARATVGGI